MDKADFIMLAPAYYELAVVQTVRKSGRYLSEESIQADWNYSPDPTDPGDVRCYLNRDALIRFVLKELARQDVVEAQHDHFGPITYREGRNIDAYLETQSKDTDSPLHKMNGMRDGDEWLKSALLSVNQAYVELGIKSEDLENPEAEWEPIPIEHESEAFLRAEAAVDKTIEEVEGSNGYATQHAEERESVLGSLKVLQLKLKTAKEISIGFVRTHGFSALRKLSARFGNTTIGKIADIAIAALLKWLGL